jgi:hypothetical protein
MDCRYLGLMELDGSIVENLENAIASARRLRGHPVYKDTLTYWADLLQEARRVRQEPSCAQSDALGVAIARLESELAER